MLPFTLRAQFSFSRLVLGVNFVGYDIMGIDDYRTIDSQCNGLFLLCVKFIGAYGAFWILFLFSFTTYVMSLVILNTFTDWVHGVLFIISL